MKKEEEKLTILEIMNKEDDLSQEEIQLFKNLMFKFDLKIKNKDGLTLLMYALKYNKDQNLNLNEEQMDYLFKNSDLKQQDYIRYTPLMYALTNNKTQNLNINEEQ